MNTTSRIPDRTLPASAFCSGVAAGFAATDTAASISSIDSPFAGGETLSGSKSSMSGVSPAASESVGVSSALPFTEESVAGFLNSTSCGLTSPILAFRTYVMAAVMDSVSTSRKLSRSKSLCGTTVTAFFFGSSPSLPDTVSCASFLPSVLVSDFLPFPRNIHVTKAR